MRGFAAALHIDGGLQPGVGAQAVVAIDGVVFQVGSQRGQQLFVVVADIACRQNHRVIPDDFAAVRIAVEQGQRNALPVAIHAVHDFHGIDLATAAQLMARLAGHLLLVEHVVDAFDQFDVRRRIVRMPSL
ncbi:hypothetical protein D3C72_1664310 [compost metagenome]